MLKYGSRFAVGFLTFIGTHAIERAEWHVWFHGEYEPWFLNSGRAILFTIACLGVASAVVATFNRSPRPDWGLTVGAGAFVAMTATLFLKDGGPGTIFPIVLVAGGAVALLSSAAGALIGTLLSQLTRSNR